MSHQTPSRIVCVYCGSSDRSDPLYRSDAQRLGTVLASRGYAIAYGGSRNGSMGALANGALAAGGHVLGVLPRVLREREIAHPGLSELRIVEDMRARKHAMLAGAHAVVALPGGSGTLEELFEAMTLRRLGLFHGPIVLVNTRGYYDRLRALLEYAVEERFMAADDLRLCESVATPEEVPEAIERAVGAADRH